VAVELRIAFSREEGLRFIKDRRVNKNKRVETKRLRGKRRGIHGSGTAIDPGNHFRIVVNERAVRI
jgi:hypothetical protein